MLSLDNHLKSSAHSNHFNFIAPDNESTYMQQMKILFRRCFLGICMGVLLSYFPASSSLAAPQSIQKDEEVSAIRIGESFKLHSKLMQETRRIQVYFPPGFDKQSAKNLPVMYMLDGGMEEDFLHIAGLIQVSVGNGSMRPFILVGIENTERRRDLTGPTDNAEDKKSPSKWAVPHSSAVLFARNYFLQ